MPFKCIKYIYIIYYVPLKLPSILNYAHNPVRVTKIRFTVHKIFQFPIIKNLLGLQWGKKVFSQPPIVQVLPLKKMREACNFHHRYTSTMRDKIRKKNPENHIVGFLKNLFANYGGK